jgi:hypothetical protein
MSSILYNVDYNILLGHIFEGLKRTSSRLPLTIQADFLEQVRDLTTSFASKTYIHPMALLLRLGPVLQLVKASTTSSPDSAFSAMLTEHTPMSRSNSRFFDHVEVMQPPEAALLAHPDHRPRAPADRGRREPRPDDCRDPGRRDYERRNSDRREHCPRDYNRRGAEIPKDRPTSSGPSRPTASRQPNESPTEEPSLQDIYKSVQTCKSQVDRYRERERRHGPPTPAQAPRRRDHSNAFVATEMPRRYSDADDTSIAHYALGAFHINPGAWNLDRDTVYSSAEDE